ncbi:glyoxalase [Nocardia sp. NPDC050710]|uniref:glyoxalase n=1 Tax=Nocardia sp. NPDC050710 TaxID=3157220 RepID=UPI0033EB91BF
MTTPEIRSYQNHSSVTTATTFASVQDLMQALIRAAIAHGEHVRHTGRHDENWTHWYAAYMVAEQTGAELPV